jgi:hypothetical protein
VPYVNNICQLLWEIALFFEIMDHYLIRTLRGLSQQFFISIFDITALLIMNTLLEKSNRLKAQNETNIMVLKWAAWGVYPNLA